MAVAKTDLFCDGAQPSVSKSRNEWHSSWLVLVAGAVLGKLVTSVDTVVVAVTQIVLLHTQPVGAVPLALWARELVWTTNNTFIVTPFVFFLLSFICMVTYSHRCHFHSPWSSFPFTLVATSIHLDCHFYAPWSSLPFTWTVISVHLGRHFHLPWSLLPIILIVISFYLDRHLHSPSSSFLLNFIGT